MPPHVFLDVGQPVARRLPAQVQRHTRKRGQAAVAAICWLMVYSTALLWHFLFFSNEPMPNATIAYHKIQDAEIKIS
jgi:hypothetical protein